MNGAIDTVAQQALGRKEAHLLALEGAFHSAISDKNVGLGTSHGDLVRRVSTATGEYVRREHEILSQLVKTQAKTAYVEGLRASKADFEPMTFGLMAEVVDISADAQSAIAHQAYRDASAVVRAVRSIAIRVDSIGRSRNWDRSAALIAVTQSLGPLPFVAKDRAGKRRSSVNHAYLSIRGALVSATTRAFVAGLVVGGVDSLRVVGGTHDGMELSISGLGADGAPLFEVFDQVFHPNSKASLAISH